MEQKKELKCLLCSIFFIVGIVIFILSLRDAYYFVLCMKTPGVAIRCLIELVSSSCIMPYCYRNSAIDGKLSFQFITFYILCRIIGIKSDKKRQKDFIKRISKAISKKINSVHKIMKILFIKSEDEETDALELYLFADSFFKSLKKEGNIK